MRRSVIHFGIGREMNNDIHSVARDGFAIFSNVIRADELEELLATLASKTTSRSRAGIRHLMRNEHVCLLAHDRRLVTIAESELGREAFPFRATLFDKSSDANWLVAWHQDTALPLRAKNEAVGWGPWSIKDGIHYAHAPASALEQVLALRVHLDDSTTENGPLRILAGTHIRGVLSDDDVAQLVSNSNPIECTVSRGGVVAMRPLILHASSKSESFAPRRVLHIEYAAPALVESGVQLAIA